MLRASPRTWVAGTAALLAVVVVSAWMLVISPARADAAESRASAAGTQESGALARARTAELRRQYAALPEQQAELTRLQAAMPQDAGLARLVRDLQSAADAAGVTLMAITPGMATAPVAVGMATAPVAVGTATAPAAVGAAAGGQITLDLPVSLEVVGGFARSELFLRSVQTELSRAFLVRSLHVTAEVPAAAVGGKPATVNGDVTMTVTGSVFVLRDSADVHRAAVAGTTATAAASPATPPVTPGPPAPAVAHDPAAAAASTSTVGAAGGTETP